MRTCAPPSPIESAPMPATESLEHQSVWIPRASVIHAGHLEPRVEPFPSRTRNHLRLRQNAGSIGPAHQSVL